MRNQKEVREFSRKNENDQNGFKSSRKHIQSIKH